MQWIPGKLRRGHEGGYALRLQAVFLALGFSRFDGESRPSHLPLTLTVRPPKRHEKRHQ